VQVGGADSVAKRELRRQERAQHRSQAAKPHPQTVVNRLLDCRIDHLEHDSLHAGRGICQHERCATHGYSDNADRLSWRLGARELNRGARIATLQIARRDVVTGTFPVRLKIEEQNRIACSRKKLSARYQTTPGASDAVHQNDNAMTLTSREKPAANRRARITAKPYCASLQILREVSNSRFRRSGQDCHRDP